MEYARIVIAEVVGQVAGIGVQNGETGVMVVRAKVPDEVRVHFESEQSGIRRHAAQDLLGHDAGAGAELDNGAGLPEINRIEHGRGQETRAGH